MPVKRLVLDEINRCAREQNRELTPFAEDSALFSFGLDSLSFVNLVARLDELSGVNLFDASEAAELPMTVGELLKFYEQRWPTAAAPSGDVGPIV